MFNGSMDIKIAKTLTVVNSCASFTILQTWLQATTILSSEIQGLRRQEGDTIDAMSHTAADSTRAMKDEQDSLKMGDI
nr:hypothetical protein L203_03276 [Cryptococcus depauperatus CBS 7841]